MSLDCSLCSTAVGGIELEEPYQATLAQIFQKASLTFTLSISTYFGDQFYNLGLTGILTPLFSFT